MSSPSPSSSATSTVALNRVSRLVSHLTPNAVHSLPAQHDLLDVAAARKRSAKLAKYELFKETEKQRVSLKGKTLFISGASRGIGLAIAVAAAKQGANVIIAAKTAEPQPNLPGTIYTAAKEIEEAGGHALPVICDIRSEESVKAAVEAGVKKFGGIDVLVNNASAISLTSTPDTTMKKYDLMHSINSRGTYLVTKTCLPYLKKSQNPHVLTLGPPLSAVQQPMWFAPHPAYTVAKYNMSLYTMAHAAEFADDGIAVNCLWPLTTIATSAVKNLLGGSDMMNKSRTPEIMADAAVAILNAPSKVCTGQFFIDEHVLRGAGVKDFNQYSCTPGTHQDAFAPDFFV